MKCPPTECALPPLAWLSLPFGGARVEMHVTQSTSCGDHVSYASVRESGRKQRETDCDMREMRARREKKEDTLRSTRSTSAQFLYPALTLPGFMQKVCVVFTATVAVRQAQCLPMMHRSAAVSLRPPWLATLHPSRALLVLGILSPFGVDPASYGANIELKFLNLMMMKTSGVLFVERMPSKVEDRGHVDCASDVCSEAFSLLYIRHDKQWLYISSADSAALAGPCLRDVSCRASNLRPS